MSLVTLIAGVLVQCDPSIKAIIVQIDSEKHDIIIEDLDDETVMVKQEKLEELKRKLGEVYTQFFAAFWNLSFDGILMRTIDFKGYCCSWQDHRRRVLSPSIIRAAVHSIAFLSSAPGTALTHETRSEAKSSAAGLALSMAPLSSSTPALTIFIGPKASASLYRVLPQSPQKKLVIGLPLSAVFLNVLYFPVTSKPSPGTTRLVLKADPVIFWQSLQWQTACAKKKSQHLKK